MEPVVEKRRSGRKKLPEDKKIRQQFIYTTDPQFEMLTKLAGVAGVSVSQLILKHFNLV